jgi:heat-inducible transcriptional repressor
MNDLTDRQKLILTLVIHEYIKSAAPIGSQALVERFHLEMSSATVRNELAVLTDLGFLRQPHTSAGRIPTEEGYRYFVGRLLQQSELPGSTRRTITHQFFQMRNDVDQWMRLSASVLAHQSHSASLVTAPHPEMARLKHVELISTRGRQILMVLVMAGGEIHQRLLGLNERFSQEFLSAMANKLTHLYESKDTDTIRSMRAQMQGLEREATDWILTEMDQANTQIAGEVYMDGLSNVLAEPEFLGSETAHRAIRVLEERSRLQDLLSRTLATSTSGGVQVLIGGEGNWEELSQFSIVLARYGTPGLITGTLGVVGPMRMSYGRAISTIRFLAGLLSDLVSDTLVE